MRRRRRRSIGIGPDKDAVISDCGGYRYELWRRWDRSKPHAVFIELNPSTADAQEDDPTIRRCVGFAEREGMGALHMFNLFPYQATDPKDLVEWLFCAHTETKIPFDRNLKSLKAGIAAAEIVVACWGAFRVTSLMRIDHRQAIWGAGDKLLCLGRTKSGRTETPALSQEGYL